MDEVHFTIDHSVTRTFGDFPKPLARMTRPILSGFHRMHVGGKRVQRFRFTSNEYDLPLINGNAFRSPIGPRIGLEQTDLDGRLDLILWYFTYQKARADRYQQEFKAKFKINGRFDVFPKTVARPWYCPDCGMQLRATERWCKKPSCPSRAKLASCLGETPPFLVLCGKRRKKNLEAMGLKALRSRHYRERLALAC